MRYAHLSTIYLTACVAAVASAAAVDAVDAAPPAISDWQVVVNNGDFMPTNTCDPTVTNPTTPPCRKFNSYNQPSVNAGQLVVIRARSRGGPGLGQPVHGIYTRDMAAGTPVVKIFDRQTLVPQPNNLGTVFIEPPSFPRIDIGSNTIATRANHQPVWRYFLEDGTETRAGTTGIYTNPFGDLITGASKLGIVPEFSFFEVPEAPGVPFDVFPGAPAVTDVSTIVFKGNYTVDLVGKTGVYYRDLVEEAIPFAEGIDLEPAGGTNPVVLIANNTDTLIPGTTTVFGSTAPPSAANRQAVFAGFDNEENPTLGGIYLAPLAETPPLTTLVRIGAQVPGESSQRHLQPPRRGRLLRRSLRGLLGCLGDADHDPGPAVPDRGQRRPHRILQRAVSQRLYHDRPGEPGHLRARHGHEANPRGRQDTGELRRLRLLELLGPRPRHRRGGRRGRRAGTLALDGLRGGLGPGRREPGRRHLPRRLQGEDRRGGRGRLCRPGGRDLPQARARDSRGS